MVRAMRWGPAGAVARARAPARGPSDRERRASVGPTSRVRILIRGRFEFGDHRQDVEQESAPTGSVGSWTEPPRLSLTWRVVSSVDDVAGVGQWNWLASL